MEERQGTLAPWVAEMRARVAASPEFRSLSQKLFVEVREGMRSNAGKATLALPPFAELSADDQMARVRAARNELLKSDEFARCREAAWRAVDAALDAESEAVLTRRPAAAAPLRQSPAAPSTGLSAALTPPPEVSACGKVDAVIELAGLGAAQLLSRWPVDTELGWEAQALAWLLNSELPPPLRRTLWRIKLRARDARSRFLAKLAESPLAIISPRDAEILQQCQVALLSADPASLSDLQRMRACASYVDSTDPIRFALEQRAIAAAVAEEAAAGSPASAASLPRKPAPPREAFWLVPLLWVLPRSECDAAELAERYTAMLAAAKPHLPSATGKIITPPAGRDGARLPDAMQLVAHADAALGAHIERAMGGALPARSLTSVHSSRLGVGLFSVAATQFVWDVGIISGWEHVEHCIASALILIRAGLLACAKSDALKAYMEATVPQLTVPQLRAALERHYMPEIRRNLHAPAPDDILPLEPSELVS
eukprot:scaffold1309_cov117-Isochrysis_galbana.AAC.10